MVRRSRDIPQSEHNETRMRRAWSWLHLSEKSRSHDEKFIFLWIAFNAAYGTELPGEGVDKSESSNQKSSRRCSEEIKRFTDFVNKIVERDHERAIETILWKKFPGPDLLEHKKKSSGPVEGLLKNKYIFSLFWKWVKGKPEGKNWRSKFEESNQWVFEARKKDNVRVVLEEVLKRLYVLRNQIIHGGTTFAEGWGRDQIRDGSRTMEALMPEILKIMQDDIDKNRASKVWEKLDYPRVGDDDQPDRITTL